MHVYKCRYLCRAVSLISAHLKGSMLLYTESFLNFLIHRYIYIHHVHVVGEEGEAWLLKLMCIVCENSIRYLHIHVHICTCTCAYLYMYMSIYPSTMYMYMSCTVYMYFYSDTCQCIYRPCLTSTTSMMTPDLSSGSVR